MFAWLSVVTSKLFIYFEKSKLTRHEFEMIIKKNTKLLKVNYISKAKEYVFRVKADSSNHEGIRRIRGINSNLRPIMLFQNKITLY